MAFPLHRPRRLRTSEALRRLVRETRLSAGDFISPIFLCDGEKVRREVPSMPGVYNLSVDEAVTEALELRDLGIPAVLLFGVPPKNRKDSKGSEAWADTGLVQRGLAAIKKRAPELCLVADTCFCEYTDHGHCGVLNDKREVENDPTLEHLALTAVSQARAGADIIAPSAMMDGMVTAIRQGLDSNGFGNTAILAYSVKYASAFYGPFRDAADSAPAFGDRRQYQMDYHNVREGLREARYDSDEGADILMVKPALSYLDVIRQVRDRSDLPLCAYNVSGEYSMVKAAAQSGWIDERRIVLEMLTSIKRAGADMIISYWAKDVAGWLKDKS